MSNKYLLKQIEHVFTEDESFNDGSFTAVRLVELFAQKSIGNQSIKDSNLELISKLGCSLSGLHYAFLILEADGILKRTFADDKKLTRTEFIFDLEKYVSWIKLTKFDKEYLEAPKRSFKRAVINQTSIFIKDVKSKLEKAVEEIKRTQKINDRIELQSIIKQLKDGIERDYTRYLKHLKSRVNKLAKTEERRQEKAYKDSLSKTTIEWIMSNGLKPPNTLKTA